MGSIQGRELRLNGSQSSMTTRCTVPRPVSEFLGQVSMMNNVSEKLRNLDDYTKRLEGEMRKIDGFKRELPLCMFLLNDAIGAIKEETVLCRKLNGEPVLGEVIQLKNLSDGEGDDKNVEVKDESKDSEEKMNWLSSAQLWTSSSELHFPNLDFQRKKQSGKPCTPKNGGEVNLEVSDVPMRSCRSPFCGHAFVPFKSYTSFPFIEVRDKEENLPVAQQLSLQTPGMTNLGDGVLASYFSSNTSACRTGSSFTSNGQCSSHSEPQSHQQQEANRKQRRCWSPELHRRFVAALQQLGGQGATPKQIRELMQVDGLTNDEVKSHLQKYRLHRKRNPVTSVSAPNQSDASRKLWPGLDMFVKTSKQRNSLSGSPPGPLSYGSTSQGTFMTGGSSMEDKEEEKSESHSWKEHVHSLEKSTV